MRCSKCQGLVIQNHADLKCINCGRYYFPPAPTAPDTLRGQLELALLETTADLQRRRRTHARHA
jgi:hypothetical protein